jgi:hypothetical protein
LDKATPLKPLYYIGKHEINFNGEYGKNNFLGCIDGGSHKLSETVNL